MPDREKVIKGLQEAVNWLSTETSLTVIDQWVVRDALALLKEQEPVEPIVVGGSRYIYCGNCHQPLCNTSDDNIPTYCEECGRAVKWE